MKSKIITFPALFLSLFVLIGFSLHLIIYTTSGLVYCALIAICVVGLCTTKPIIKKAIPNYYSFIWVVTLLLLWFNYFFRYRSNDVLIDDVVFTCGLFIILLFSVKYEDYNAALSLLLFMAFFFATGVYLQRFSPNTFRLIARIFPSRFQSSIIAGIGNEHGVKGFTTNSGFTANYIMTGIFVVISRFNERKTDRKTIIQLVFLFVALLFTGKRGPLVFFMISTFLVGIIPVRGSKKMKRVWRAFLVFLLLVVVYYTLGTFLERLPYIGRYIESINAYINGEDISSGRSRLYTWAIQLFVRNPLIGIGWGKYRTTVAGNATFIKSLDTHNVYLQLLCETGIVGFLIFVTLFITSWTMTKNAYCSCLSEENEELKKWRPALLFSFLFQTYFILFALTGNPLYDQFYQVIYVFSCSIMIAYRYVASYRRA